jgi:hypothetical protein
LGKVSNLTYSPSRCPKESTVFNKKMIEAFSISPRSKKLH